MRAAAAAFVGSIPERYDRHLGPVLFEPYARALARRVPAGPRQLLEIAAGTGRLTRHLLAALPPTATVLATDLNPPMLAAAAQRITDARVIWCPADAQALPLAAGAVDLVACQFGLMFVPDKLQAVREMRRVLRPGGRALVTTWDALDRNVASAILHARALALAPEDPPAFMLTPFSMGAPATLGALFVAAGFGDVQVETLAAVGESPSAADFAIGLVRGTPLSLQLVERGVDATAFEREVTAALVAAFGDHPCRHPLSAHLVTAVA